MKSIRAMIALCVVLTVHALAQNVHRPGEVGGVFPTAGSVSSPSSWRKGAPPVLVSTVYVDDNYTSSSCGGHTWGVDAFTAIQAGIDAVASGGTVRVYPGTYSETASGRILYNATGPYQFGLFFEAAKPGITVMG
ncbi:MAG: hypothetical protein IPP94_15905 [Ignavibacteria bacterium]|nr:hypothetical protein [Ignavibacteria bacterium]